MTSPWHATGKTRWPPPVAAPVTLTSIADTRAGGITRHFDGLPFISLPLTGAPTPGDSERAQAGFRWSRLWHGTTNPTYAEAEAFVEIYPYGDDTGWDTPDGLSLFGEVWPASGVGAVIMGELDVATLTGYDATTPLNLFGASLLVGAEPYGAWMHAYATSTHVHAQSLLRTNTTNPSAWASREHFDQPVYMVVEMLNGGLQSWLSVALTSGAVGGPWG